MIKQRLIIFTIISNNIIKIANFLFVNQRKLYKYNRGRYAFGSVCVCVCVCVVGCMCGCVWVCFDLFHEFIV